ncbi:MAG TPA: TIGR03619 family F420-dependent LLM class oxidoreductase [Steroidobacteraceae bacterium]|nr:TIGR03619 family F420-dependent LLM class oxidoreductase [Steroidobacteraceae bacterium]
MKIGISIPNNWGVHEAPRLIDLAERAEQLGFASVWTSEHLINLAYVRARIGDRPYYHPLAILSAIASRTRRIALGTSVIVLPFHNPFDLAKYVATLDQISAGRVILGVGVGNVREEFETMGIAWEKRGAITDESIQIMRVLWSQEEAHHAGDRWQFSGVHTSPKSFEGRRIPIWIGGMSAAACRRVARFGDGWHPTALTPDELRQRVTEIRALTRSAGRAPESIDICMRFNLALDDVELTPTELRSTVRGEDTRRIIEVAEAFADAGATHFIYALNSHEPDRLVATVTSLARDLLPRVCAA